MAQGWQIVGRSFDLHPFLRYPGSKQQTPRKKLWTGTKNEGQMRTFLKKQGTWAKNFGCKQWQLRQVYSLHKQNEFSWGWGLTLKLDNFCFPNKLYSCNPMSLDVGFLKQFSPQHWHQFSHGSRRLAGHAGHQIRCLQEGRVRLSCLRGWCCLSLTRSCMCPH